MEQEDLIRMLQEADPEGLRDALIEEVRKSEGLGELAERLGGPFLRDYNGFEVCLISALKRYEQSQRAATPQ